MHSSVGPARRLCTRGGGVSCEFRNIDMKPTGDEARNEASARVSGRVKGQARSLN
jgi:hypothetical protein